jgi:hypothetical protein
MPAQQHHFDRLELTLKTLDRDLTGTKQHYGTATLVTLNRYLVM